jgi:LemA protein
MLIAIIVIVVLLALVGFVVVGFNKLRTSDIGAQEALGGIDVQLTRRAELIPNLVETVKGYAAHEAGVFEEVTKARAGVIAAAAGDDVPAKAAADAALQQALVKVNAVAEAYPDLKANQNFLQLQSQLAETENQIAFARQYYNDAVASLNKLVMTIPWMLLTGIANVHKREFYDAPEGQQVAPQVSFGTNTPAAPAAAPPAAPAAAPPAAPAAAPPAAAPPAAAPPAAPPTTPTDPPAGGTPPPTI